LFKAAKVKKTETNANKVIGSIPCEIPVSSYQLKMLEWTFVSHDNSQSLDGFRECSIWTKDRLTVHLLEHDKDYHNTVAVYLKDTDIYLGNFTELKSLITLYNLIGQYYD
jgi:hypothetical protein